MRRLGMAAVAALGLLAGCKGNNSQTTDGYNRPSGDAKRAALQQTEKPFENAEKARVDASKQMDHARLSGEKVGDAAEKLTKAQDELAKAQSPEDKQKAQQKVNEAQQEVAQAQARASQEAQRAAQAQSQAAQADAQYRNQRAVAGQEILRPTMNPSQTQVAADKPGAAQTAQGTVANIQGSQLTLNVSGQQAVTLQTDAATQVSVDGRLVRLKELKPGTEVRVAFTPAENGANLAHRIDAVTTAPSAPAEPSSAAPQGGSR